MLIDRQYQLSDEHQAQQVIVDATADDVLGLSATATIQAEAIEASREQTLQVRRKAPRADHKGRGGDQRSCVDAPGQRRANNPVQPKSERKSGHAGANQPRSTDTSNVSLTKKKYELPREEHLSSRESRRLFDFRDPAGQALVDAGMKVISSVFCTVEKLGELAFQSLIFLVQRI